MEISKLAELHLAMQERENQMFAVLANYLHGLIDSTECTQQIVDIYGDNGLKEYLKRNS